MPRQLGGRRLSQVRYMTDRITRSAVVGRGGQGATSTPPVVGQTVLTVGVLETNFGFNSTEGPYGSVLPTTLFGQTLQWIYGETISDSFRVGSGAQFGTATEISVTLTGAGTPPAPFTLVFNGFSWYDGTIVGPADYLQTQNGLDVTVSVTLLD